MGAQELVERPSRRRRLAVAGQGQAEHLAAGRQRGEQQPDPRADREDSVADGWRDRSAPPCRRCAPPAPSGWWRDSSNARTRARAYRTAGGLRPARGDLDSTLAQLDLLKLLGLPEEALDDARTGLLAGAGVTL